MPYVESITIAGKTKEIERYFTSRYKKKGIVRGDKVKPTKEEQKKCNTRRAEKNLRRVMNANFEYGDYHMDVGYVRKQGEPYRTKEQMRKDMDKLLKYLRIEYTKQGKLFKYIHVMEIGEKGARHHHLLINRIDTRIVQQCWNKVYPKQSKIHFTPLDDTGQYKNLAAYFIKYTDKTVGTEDALQGKRWNCSKNLIRPEPQITIINNREWFRSEPKEQNGYFVDLDTVEKGVHSPDYYGYGYFRYTLVQLNERAG